MIASHDTFTYQKPRNILLNLISIWWRCQKLNIKQQYDTGVRIFDVRIYRYKNEWYTAHGMARFKEVHFKTLIDLCEYFKQNLPGSIIRIYLEDNCNKKKNEKILELFLEELYQIFNKYKDMLWEGGTHFPWKTYYRNENFHPNIIEYYCHLLNWDSDKSIMYNIKNLDFSQLSLPYYAKKHNPIITQEMINDPNVMHILDYVGIYK